MKKNQALGKHTHNNRESREGEILKYIREARKLSLLDVAQRLNLKAVDVDHFENGRKFYTENDLKMFLNEYKIEKEFFQKILSLKVMNRQVLNHLMLGT